MCSTSLYLSLPHVEEVISSLVTITLKSEGCTYSPECSYFLFHIILFS